jgi:16S rRNA G527 N7-methylase RsmG
VTLIESRRRPASFLREVARSVPLPNVEVVEDRWELWAGRHPRSLDLVTGRAIRLEVLLEPAATVLAPGGRVVGMQSQRVGGHELSDVAARYGLGLVETRAYELPSGEPRQLVVFGRP